jgi:CRP-like cAMP-binding protein
MRLAHKHVIPVGAAIFRERAPADNVVLIRSGRVKVWSVSRGGREVAFPCVGPGELLGETSALDGRPPTANASAVQPVDALSIPAADFCTFVRDTPTAMSFVAERISCRLRDAESRRVEQATNELLGRVAIRLVESLARYERASEPLGRLTKREHSVLVLIAEGLNNAEIADALSLSRRTVECHVAAILTKLDIGPDANGARRVKTVLAYQRAVSEPERWFAATRTDRVAFSTSLNGGTEEYAAPPVLSK